MGFVRDEFGQIGGRAHHERRLRGDHDDEAEPGTPQPASGARRESERAQRFRDRNAAFRADAIRGKAAQQVTAGAAGVAEGVGRRVCGLSRGLSTSASGGSAGQVAEPGELGSGKCVAPLFLVPLR